MSSTATPTIKLSLHFAKRQSNATTVYHGMVEEVVGVLAGPERHSCTQERRTARGDRSSTGGVADTNNGGL